MMRAIGLQVVLTIVLLVPRAARADEQGPQGGGPPPPTENSDKAEKAEKPEVVPPQEPKDTHEGQYLKTPIRPREIVVDIPGVRPTQTKLMLYSLAAATVIAGGVGLYYHLDSRDAANSVSRQVFEGETWTADRQALFEQGERSRGRAAIWYTAGGLFLTGTVVALIVTEPKSERQVIRPRHAGIAPTPGGAIAGAGWSF
jgi:hypothetical protein